MKSVSQTFISPNQFNRDDSCLFSCQSAEALSLHNAHPAMYHHQPKEGGKKAEVDAMEAARVGASLREGFALVTNSLCYAFRRTRKDSD